MSHVTGAATSHPGMVRIPGGTFRMGSDHHYVEEKPVHTVTVSGFWMDETPVTNAQFRGFIEATGHVTEAERFGWSFVFGGLLPDDFPDTRGVASTPWWRQVFGADWRHPDGPHSDLSDRDDHPAVHVAWTDATAYASWAGARLPTEAEWERAARAGSTAAYPWGNELEPDGRHMANVWQGEFPNANTLADGWLGTSPVGTYPANDFGLVDTIGNVWEWTADWFSPHHGGDPVTDPTGPSEGTHRVMKGGSYLCHASYCRRYRPAARLGNTPDSSAGNVGFRVVTDG